MPVAAIAPMNREAVVGEMLPLVRKTAAQLARKTPRHAHIQEDLVSAGMEGLLCAIDRFDPRRRVAFQAFALQRVRGAMLDELRRLDPLTRDQRRDSRRRLETVGRLEQKLGRTPEEAEVARGMGLGLDSYRTLVRTISASIAVTVAEEGDERGTCDPNTVDPEAACRHSEAVGALREALAALPERTQVVLSLLYVEDLNLREAGLTLGVSESRICQIHGEAIKRLREALVDVA
jgi:RNA polymerase sigma factor FliA